MNPPQQSDPDPAQTSKATLIQDLDLMFEALLQDNARHSSHAKRLPYVYDSVCRIKVLIRKAE